MSLDMSLDNIIVQGNYDDIIVPKRFSDRIFCHVVSHYLTSYYFFRPPLYLVIEGKPGEGKTIQTIASCKQRGIEVIYISGSELAGKLEGDSKQTLEEYYRKAIDFVSKGIYLAILIDDFHLSNAVDDEEVKCTINSRILINYMMNLSSRFTVRIPIILTGNDFSKIYAPLIRDGRADLFFWQPTDEEKIEIVKRVLTPIISESDQVKLDSFIESHLSESIAFFSQLRNDYRLNIMLALISNLSILNQSIVEKLDSEIRNRYYWLTVDDLEILANRRIRSKSRR